MLREFDHPRVDRRKIEPLTRREREIVALMAAGVTSDHEIAERLVVSGNTVKYHLGNIFAKLQMRNRAQVVAYALRNGMV